MQRLARILTGVAGLAIVAGSAAPALAQSNYGYGSQYGGQYGGQYGQYPNNGGVAGAIGQILGGGRYGAYGQGADRVAVDQCARAAESRASRTSQGGGYYDQNRGYNGYGNSNGYGYGNAYGGARVLGITKVERRSSGLKIYGLMSSGIGYQGQYGQTPYGYGQGYPGQGYGDPRYGGQSYPGYPGQGYGGQGYGTSQTADLSFNCRVDYRGYVTDVSIKRNVPQRAY